MSNGSVIIALVAGPPSPEKPCVPVPAGGIYMAEQNRIMFPSVDNPTRQTLGAFSQGELLPEAAGATQVLVPRAAGVTSYYPAVSDDNVAVVFNQSDCQGPTRITGYGEGACDGYDDLSATLNVVPVAGSRVTPLTRANGSPNSGNSWPRFSPDHGTFRGAKLYWVAFSSRRPYGLQVNQAGINLSKPQLWFAAVSAMGDFATDSSFAAIWLPGQNADQASPNGSHVPNWVKRVVTIIQ